MDKQYQTLFKNLAEYKPPNGFSDAIFARIMEIKRNKAKHRSIFYVSAAAISCLAFIPAARFALDELYRTGFYDYLSLAISDSGTVLASWKEFTLSLADSLPVAAMMFVLSTVFAFAGSLFMAVKNFGIKSKLASA